MMRFCEFVEREEFEALKKAVLNALGATDDGVNEPLSSYKKSKKLLNEPNIQKFFRQAGNQEAITSALDNADVTKISIADLLALFRAGSEKRERIDANKNKKNKKRPMPPMPEPNQDQDQEPNQDQDQEPNQDQDQEQDQQPPPQQQPQQAPSNKGKEEMRPTPNKREMRPNKAGKMKMPGVS
jgi:hypothetical protein